MMTIVPTKPPHTSAQRSALTCSCSIQAASKVMTRGAISAIAVNSPTGMYLRLKNASRLLPNSNRPRES